VVVLETGEDIERSTLVWMVARNLYRHLPPITKATGFVVIDGPETRLEYNHAMEALVA
jgi:hypothetical protein